ncbi:hypothetical protein [Aciditerrimonas ferrireducens]|nr:hypothetical protein [Aciditerrimonas ferrireducens]MCK4177888.1 hypothetical protein [Aciditerrimonas ferrireducens]
MERFLVVHCPALAPLDDRGRHARGLAQVLALLQELSARPPEALGPGLAALATRGPARYFGGDWALAAHVRDLLAKRLGLEGHLGVADGLLAAVLAAELAAQGGQEPVVVPPGQSPAFLAPWPVAVLGQPKLADLLARLGVRRLGQLAALPPAAVAERLGTLGLACWQVATGQASEPPGLRRAVPGLPEAQALLAHDHQAPSRRGASRRGAGRPAPGAAEQDLFGARDRAGQRAARAATQLQALLGPEAVLRARLTPGRSPATQVRLLPVGVGREPSGAQPSDAPWPGRLPTPSPALLLQPPRPAELWDAQGRPLRVGANGQLSGPPAWLATPELPGHDRPPRHRWALTSWAGPWPQDERWWAARRRRAYLQVVATEHAFLVLQEGRRWWLEGLYD